MISVSAAAVTRSFFFLPTTPRGYLNVLLGLIFLVVSMDSADAQNNALNFDGVKDYASVASGPAISGSSFTVEMWIKSEKTGYSSSNPAQWLKQGDLHIGFRGGANDIRFAFYFNDLDVGGSFPEMDWVHWAFVYDKSLVGNNRFIYRNGVLVAQDESPSDVSANGVLEFGRRVGSEYFDGSMDELRIWNVARSQAEIVAAKNMELVGNESGLLAYYNFNQGVANGDNTAITMINDATGNFNATVNGLDLTSGSESNFVAGFTPPEINVYDGATNGATVITDAQPTDIDFGSAVQGNDIIRTFAIENSGQSSLNVNSITTTDAEYTVNSSITMIAPNVTETFTITLSGTNSGPFNSTVTIVNDDPDENIFTFPVAGSILTAPPTNQATNLTFTNVSTTSMTLNWTNGNGANRIVVARESGPVNSSPSNSTTYTDNAAFTSGTQIGTGNYVVYEGAGSSVTVTGLTPGETYHFRVYEYDGTAGDENYNVTTATGNPANESALTIPTLSSISPAQNAINITASDNIVFTFSETMSQNSVDGGTGTVLDDNIQIRSASNGRIAGAWSGDGTTALTFNPTADFDAGAEIHITITQAVLSSASVSLTQSFTSSFITKTTTGPETPDSFVEHVINTSVDGINATYVIDLDSDGDLDVISGSASANNDEIAWFENDGNQNFTKFIIAANFNASPSTPVSTGDPIGISSADMDGDGDLDILSASLIGENIVWYENDGNEGFTIHEIKENVTAARIVSAVDLDGDGDMDVLSCGTDGSNDDILWFENDGAQNFTEHTISVEPFATLSLNYIDFDQDGDLDVINCIFTNSDISWHENDGSQNFTEQGIITSANGPVEVHASDLDTDGDLDLVVASFNNDRVLWYENDGAMNFTEHIVSTNTNGVVDVYSADIDGDSDLDILTTSFAGDKISWFENDGNENFTERIVTTAADGASSAFLVDMDGDQDLDFVASHRVGDQIAWYENTFAPPTTQATNITFSNLETTQMDVSWTNGNGTNRIVVAHAGAAVDTDPTDQITYTANAAFTSGTQIGTGNYVVYEGTGSSVTVTGLTPGVTYHFRVYEYDGTAGDENYNVTTATGNPANESALTIPTLSSITPAQNVIDIAASDNIVFTFSENMSQNSVDGSTGTVLDDNIQIRSASNGEIAGSWSGDGTTTLTFNPTTDFDPGEVVHIVVTQAVQSTGAVSLTSPSTSYFIAETTTGPATPDFFNENVVSTGANQARTVHVGDVDGDGDLDILSASNGDDKIAWYENDGAPNPTFTERVVSNVDGAFGVHVGDMDGDGDLDILSAATNDDKISWYENNGAVDPTFTEQVVSVVADGARSVHVDDVDGDGDLDILSASFQDNKIAWYENDGAVDPTFTEWVVSSLVNNAVHVYTGDMDGDGDLDILSASRGGDRIAWYENDGAANPTFAEQVVSTAADAAQSVQVGDMDGDGDLDILSASFNDNTIAWYENDGATDPSFTERTVSTGANGAQSVHMGDVDGDGDLDILSASAGDDKIAWYENDGAANPTFTERVVSTTANGAQSVHIGDVDGDGDLDILAASSLDDKIAWYENTFAPPTTQATNIAFTNIATTQMDVSWTNGNGTNRIVVAHAGAAVDTDPTDQITYTANAAFTSGTQIGTGNYVVYEGTGSSVTVTGLTPGETYHFRVYEYDGTTGEENYNVTTATGNPASQLFIVTAVFTIDAIADANVNENSTYTSVIPSLSGAAPLGTVTYTLGGADAADFTINSSTGVVSMVARDFENPEDATPDNIYEVTITATDSHGNNDTEDWEVTVDDVVEAAAFTIDAIADANINENSAYTSVTPAISGATPIGTLTYTLGGADAADFTINNTSGVVSMIARDFENPEDADLDNIYELTITATDSDGNNDTEGWTVTVDDVTEVVSFTITTINNANVDENTAYTSVTPAISGATPIGTLTYTLGGADAGDFTIAPTTGVVSMVARDFENPADDNTDNIYEVTITATDNDGNNDVEDWTVTVGDLSESAVFTIDAIADANVDENAAYTSITPSLSGATPVGTLTYTLGGADAGDFTIAPTTGVVSMVTRDFENPADDNTDNIYEVAITATDSDGNNDTEDWTVTVDDVVEAAAFTINTIANTNVDENTAYTSVTPAISGTTPIGSLTYTLGGADAADFTINSTSGIMSMVIRDFENPADDNTDNIYEVTITATDSDGNNDTEDWTVTVDDVVEVAAFTIDAISNTNVDENAAYTSVTPSISGATPIGILTYTLGGADADDFTIVPTTGVVSMVARDFENPADATPDNVYEVTITATDSDGNNDTEPWTVTVDDVIEAAVFTIDAIADTNIDENSAYTSVTPSLSGATPIGTLTYTLGGADAADFTINSTSGVVSMIARDFENPEDADLDNIYELTITATDSDGNSDVEDWTVSVDDVVEAVVFTIDAIANSSVDENSTYTSVTPATSGATPIGTLTYILGGADAADFTIAPTTGIVSMVARDFENPEDASPDNVYEVTITATDSDGNNDTEDWTVTVDDVIEAVVFTIDAIADLNINENSAYTSVTPSLSGATPIGTLTYTLGGADAGDFTIAPTTGIVSMIARDFEAPEDGNADNIYELTITATDSDGNSDTEDWAVMVDDVIEAAVFTIDAITDANINENSAYTSVTPSLSGAAPIGTLTYTLGGVDAADFTINSSTGVVSMVARDFENPEDADLDNIYELTITAIDSDGNSDTEDWAVMVDDAIEAAVFTIDAITDANINENSAYTSVTPSLSGAAPIGTLSYTLGGADAADFTIAPSTGIVSMVARDFETPEDADTDNVFEVTITATDNDANEAMESWTVTVDDVTETASFTITTIADANVNENSAYTSVTPSITGTPIGTLTYTLGGADAGDFTIAPTTGIVSMVARDFEIPEDADTDNVYEVTITATDSDANEAMESWTVTVDDVTETASFTITTIADANVNENSAYTSVTPSIIGTPIGTLTYTLGGADAGDFTIAPTTGIVSMIARDFEAPEDGNADNIYELTITATDSDGNSDVENWTVTIDDVDETVPVPEIEILAGTSPFSSGDTETLVSSIQPNDATQTFTINNLGSADLTISSSTFADGTSYSISSITSPIAAGGTSNFTVTLDGATSGTFSDVLTIVSNDADESSFIINLSGTISATPVPEIEILAGADPFTLGDTETLTSSVQPNDATQTFTINNLGSADLTISSSTFADGTSYSISSITSPIASGGSTTFTVTLDGSTDGTFNDVLTLATNDADEGSFVINLTGTITATPVPEIEILAGADPFTPGDTETLTSSVQPNDATQTFTINNLGSADLTISSSTFADGTSYSISSITSPIAAGGSTNFTVTLDGSTDGTFNDVLTLATNDADEGSFVINLTGTITATPVPEIEILAGTAPFTSGGTETLTSSVQPNDATQTFTINNLGSADLTISSSTFADGTSYSISSITSPIASGGSANFTVTLDGATSGTFSNVLTIVSNDADESSFIINLTGTITATPVPEIVIFEGANTSGNEITNGQSVPIDFGSDIQGSELSRSITIANSGNVDLLISDISTTAPFSTSSIPSTIGSGSSATFSINMDASVAGEFMETVTITSNDQDESSFTFSVSATISAEAVVIRNNGTIIVKGSSIDFGITPKNEPTIHTLLIENPSDTRSLDISSVTTDHSGFIVMEAPESIEPGGSGNLVIEFSATVTGTFVAEVVVESAYAVFDFEIAGEVVPRNEEVHVYNVLTPNGDGMHDFLKIERITEHTNNLVTIFNRAGRMEYQVSGYDNVNVRFEGYGNQKSNDRLPPGTYYYVIKLNRGNKKTGFIQIAY